MRGKHAKEKFTGRHKAAIGASVVVGGLVIPASFVGNAQAAETKAPAATSFVAKQLPEAIKKLPKATGVYTVKPGDSLSAIADAHHIGWRTLYNANRSVVGGDPSLIHPGQRLTLHRATVVRSVHTHTAKPVAHWTPTILHAMDLVGMSHAKLARVRSLMTHESSGNPNAINRWDVNAKAGNPSRGLMQTTGTTFRRYHVAGTSWNIYDPLANVAASLSYINHVYGGVIPNSPY